jgi:hypothetical protein
MARESQDMRRKQIEKNNTRKRSERQQRSFEFLQGALSLVSHVAAIVGTVAALVDLIHHW